LISYLYNKNLLNYNPLEPDIKNENLKMHNTIVKFWKSFDESIHMNKRGFDGKTRILSVIADNFRHREIREKLKVNF
jgi:hypothetical protein